MTDDERDKPRRDGEQLATRAALLVGVVVLIVAIAAALAVMGWLS